MKKNNGLLSGAFVLLAANIFVKITGLVYKIPLQRMLGDIGMGYFNIAYSIYTWFYIVSTSGLPIAVSVCIARANAEGLSGKCRRIFKVSALAFASLGLLCTSAMMIFCKGLSAAASIDNAYLCIAAIAPSVALSCVSAAVRGYYQGFGIMWVTAVSQAVESAGRLIFGILFSYVSIHNGNDLYVTAAYAVAGTTCGSALSALFCMTVKLFYKKLTRDSDDEKPVLPTVLKTALPVALSSSVINLTGVIDVFTAPAGLLRIGYTENQAAEIFGNYSTLCTSFLNLPMIFIHPITGSLLPRLAACRAQGDTYSVQKMSKTAMKTALFISMPCAFGMCIMSRHLLSLLFPLQSALLASPMLSVLSVSVVPCAALAVTDTILHSDNRSSYPVISMLAGAAVKALSGLFLFDITSVGRLAIPAGTTLCYITAVFVNLLFVRKHCARLLTFSDIVKPAAASSLCAVAAHFTMLFISRYVFYKASVILSVLTAAAVYMLFILPSGFMDDVADIKELKVFKKYKETKKWLNSKEKRNTASTT